MGRRIGDVLRHLRMLVFLRGNLEEYIVLAGAVGAGLLAGLLL